MKFAFSAALVAALAMLPASSLEVAGKRIEAAQAAAPGRCDYNRLMPDPTSGRVAVWSAAREPRAVVKPTWPGQAYVVDLPSKAGGLRFIRIEGPTRVEPLRWSASGDRLLLRADRSGAILYDPAARTLSAAPGLDPLFQRLTVEALSHGDTGFYHRPAWLDLARRIGREGPPPRWLAYVGTGRTAFLAFRLGNGHRLTGHDETGNWDTGLPISLAHSALLVPGSRRPTFLGDQAGGAAFLAYSRPLVDRASGRIAGRFGLERIEPKRGRAIDLWPKLGRLVTIKDSTANGETVFALVDLGREMRILRLKDGGMESWRLCGKTSVQVGATTAPPENALPAGVRVVRTEVHFGRGRAGDGAFGLLYRPEHSDGRLVVHFHGGPTATLADRTVPLEVQQLAGAGISVLAVEQSGMLGGGRALTERLRRLGHEALREDVAAVTRWVRRSNYRQVYLIGDSFGGASGVIAATEHREAYRHIFLRAPYLAMREPERTVDRSTFGEGATPAESQVEFEEMLYGGAGGRARFAADLRASTARLRPSPRLSFYFGSLDPVSAPGDLPPAFAGHPSILVVRATHEAAYASPAVGRDILAKLGGR